MPSKFLPTALFAAAIGVFVLAAVPSSQAAKLIKPALPQAGNALGLTLSLDKATYTVPAAKPGATNAAAPPCIHAALVFFNHSPQPVRLTIHGSATDWQILDAQGKVVWDYSVGRAIPHNIRIVTLHNSQLRYAQDIPLHDQDGTPLVPGVYTLRASLPGALGAAASLDFTVTR